jgi:pyrroline-5-carboxylate reductase
MNMHQAKLAFIGAGNIANAIVSGLIAKGISPAHITVSDPLDEQLDQFREMGTGSTHDNRHAVEEADVVLLSVKPDKLPEVAKGIAESVKHKNPLVISVAAGVTLTSLSAWMGKGLALVRCMPNTPALVQLGASGLFANAHVSAAQRSLAEEIVNAIGISLWMDDESQLDTVTAISGSGPAYFFFIMEIMTQVGINLGLSSESSKKLVLQTALGAATMATQATDDPAELRRRVTSPGGTTAAALESLQESKLGAILEAAIIAAQDRSIELSEADD